MIPARALFYALVISLLIALVSGALISLSAMQRQQQEIHLNRQRLVQNLNSGIAILQSKVDEPFEAQLDLFGDGGDSISIARFDWGLYSIGLVEAMVSTVMGKDTLTRAFYLGAQQDDLLQSALYLIDQREPLALVGNTEIRGKAFLPKSGVRRSYVDGRGYIGTKLIYGPREKSKSSLPTIVKEKIQRFEKQVHDFSYQEGLPQRLYQSFQKGPWAYRGADIYLSGYQLGGQIAIIATDSIYVAANCQLADVLLVAPKITFEAGFAGQVQAFAQEMMVVGENCQFEYPSVLGILRPANGSSACRLTLGENSQLSGLVILHEKAYHRRAAEVHLEQEVTLTGQVYAEGTVFHRGRIHGNLSCRKIRLRTSSAIYDNHLLDAVINQYQLPELFASPFIGKNYGKTAIVKWVE